MSTQFHLRRNSGLWYWLPGEQPESFFSLTNSLWAEPADRHREQGNKRKAPPPQTKSPGIPDPLKCLWRQVPILSVMDQSLPCTWAQTPAPENKVGKIPTGPAPLPSFWGHHLPTSQPHPELRVPFNRDKMKSKISETQREWATELRKELHMKGLKNTLERTQRI